MSFFNDPLLVMAGMIIPLLLECENIVDPLLLGNTETMDHLPVLVYVTMMTLEERLHLPHLNETGLLLHLILGVVIPRRTLHIVVMVPHRHPPMTVTNGGQMKNIRQLMLSPPGQGRVPLLQGQGKIMIESHPGNLSTYLFIPVLLAHFGLQRLP
jgi:hypothetical protein